MKPKRKSPFGKGSRRELDIEMNPTWAGNVDFKTYGFGYFNAGDLLARTIINAETGKWQEWNLDEENIEWLVGDVLSAGSLIYPLLGLYRQGTELMLKHFIYDKPNAPEFDEAAKRHQLLKMWSQAKAELFALGLKEESDEIRKIQVFVEKLDGLDPRGEAVRFPTDYLRQIFFKDYDIINIEPIFQDAREVREIFYGLAEGRQETWSESMEMYIDD